MDIVKDLWPAFVEEHGDQLKEFVKTHYDWTPFNTMIRINYNEKRNLSDRGLDFGIIEYALDKDAPDWITFGRFWVDYSEPAIMYELNEPEDLL